MKNLKNSLFKKFEQNKIHNLSKVIGGVGEIYPTRWTGSNGTSGGDEVQIGYCELHNVGGLGKGDIICMDYD